MIGSICAFYVGKNVKLYRADAKGGWCYWHLRQADLSLVDGRCSVERAFGSHEPVELELCASDFIS